MTLKTAGLGPSLRKSEAVMSYFWGMGPGSSSCITCNS